MKCLERNKRELWYALYTGKSAVTDSAGHKTGEYALTYGAPVQMRANYSAGSDVLTLGEAGIEEQYDRIMVVDDLDCPIAEDTRIWLGISPSVSVSTSTVSVPHNYVVSKRQDGLDSVKYGLSKVKVS